MKVARVLPVLLALLSVVGGAKSWAQGGSIDPSFNTGVVSPTNAVFAMCQQSDGKILVGGNFTKIGSASINRIARLAQDGTIDQTFNPGRGPNGSVTQIAIQSDGKILIAGSFMQVASVTCPGVARLNADGSVDTTFNSGLSVAGQVSAIAVQSDGRIVLGGVTTAKIARLNSDGTVDSTFTPGTGFNARVFTVLLQSDGRIIVAGSFTSVSGVLENHLARLNTDGTLDISFNVGGGPKSDISGAYSQSTGQIVVAGTYSGSSAVTSRAGFYRLNADGSLDSSFNAGAGPNNTPSQVAIAPDDSIILSGGFSYVEGAPRTNIAKLLPNGSVDPLFNAGAALTASPHALAVESDGRVLVAPSTGPILRLLSPDTSAPQGAAPSISALTDGAGVRLMWTPGILVEGYGIERSADGISDWTSIATTSGENILHYYDGGLAAATTYYYRVHDSNRYGNGAVSSPTPATTLPAVWPGQVTLGLDPALGGVAGPLGFSGTEVASSVCTVRPDGKVIAAVTYSQNPSGAQQSTIVRLNPDGTLDQLYDVSSSFSTIYSIVLQSDGQLVVGGSFNASAGTDTRTLARFNVDGSEDATFTVRPDGTVTSIVQQADGKMVIGGSFQHVGGAARNCIARLNGDGSLDMTFDPGSGFNAGIYSLALDPSGRIVAGGNFSIVNGITVGNVVRLNSDGSVDPSFSASPGANDLVNVVAALPNGQILIGGSFTTYNLAPVRPVVRLNGDGSLDPAFSYATGSRMATGFIIQADGGTIVAQGTVARLTATGALDPTFNIGLSASLSSLCLSPDGHLIGLGNVTFSNGTTQSGPIELSLTGGLAPPYPPASIAVTPAAGVSLQISWPAVTAATSYLVERSPDGESGWTQVGQAAPGATTYTDSGLAQSALYYYRVRSANASGISLPSPSANAYTVSLPGVPANFTARAYGYEEVVLNWSIAGNDSGVMIQRSVNGVDWVTIANVSIYTNGYLDTGLTGQTGYYYRVVTTNPVGDIAMTSGAAITTAPSGLVTAGSLDPTFAPGAALQGASGANYPTSATSILVQPDGRIIVCGVFASYGGVPRKAIARINFDGSIDPTFDPGPWNCIQAISALLQSDGKILVAGSFLGTNGYSQPGLVRLNSDGSMDSTFDASAVLGTGLIFYSGISAMCLQADGKILLGGEGLARLNPDGSSDPTFSSPTLRLSVDLSVTAVAVTADGHILVSGPFTYVNNVPRADLARLNGDGTLDASFVPATVNPENWEVSSALVAQPDGKVLAGVLQFVGTAIVRYNPDGSLDSSFTPPTISYGAILTTAALQGDGKIVVAGGFTAIGGVNRSGIARLNADGSVDTAFDTGLGESVFSVAIQPDGNILVGGDFTSVENQSRNGVARLLGSPVTWSAYQVWEIGFDVSPKVAGDAATGADGLPLLVEYALGANPNVTNPAIFPVLATATQDLTLTYNQLRSDVIYAVEVSNDLVHWTTAGVDQGTPGTTVTASVPMNGEKLFLRLRVTH